MPIQNTQGAFNTGRDCTVIMIGDFGRVDIANVTGFDAKQEVTPVKVDRLDGVQMNARLPKGWSGTFEFERGSPSVDQFFAAREVAWYASGSYFAAQVFQTVVEANGSTSTFAYDNVALTYDDAGSWKGDQSVKCRISFEANRRRVV